MKFYLYWYSIRSIITLLLLLLLWKKLSIKFIRAKIFHISGNMTLLDHFESFSKKHIFHQLFRRATRDLQALISPEVEKEYSKECSTWFSSAVQYGLFCTFWSKMNKICIVFPEIFSKTLYFDRFSVIFRQFGIICFFLLKIQWIAHLSRIVYSSSFLYKETIRASIKINSLSVAFSKYHQVTVYLLYRHFKLIIKRLSSTLMVLVEELKYYEWHLELTLEFDVNKIWMNTSSQVTG